MGCSGIGCVVNQICWLSPSLCCPPTLPWWPRNALTPTTPLACSTGEKGLQFVFGAKFTLNPDLSCEERLEPQAMLERRLGSLTARDQEMTHLFLLVFRSLQLLSTGALSAALVTEAPHQPSKANNSGSLPGKSPLQKKPPKESLSEPKVSPGTKIPSGGKGEKERKKAKKKEAGETETGLSVGQKPNISKCHSISLKVSYKESSEREGPSDGEELQLTNEEDSEASEEPKPSGPRKGKEARERPRVQLYREEVVEARRK
ncbi:hypothetical protein J4Q44_G00260800 [Coregonus suidteri]|uniref:Uncharacterized protein n=1 Tax=Coregonus suidteri TaxID=861788 RepID=A0AAN8LH93_9TELE